MKIEDFVDESTLHRANVARRVSELWWCKERTDSRSAAAKQLLDSLETQYRALVVTFGMDHPELRARYGRDLLVEAYNDCIPKIGDVLATAISESDLTTKQLEDIEALLRMEAMKQYILAESSWAAITTSAMMSLMKEPAEEIVEKMLKPGRWK